MNMLRAGVGSDPAAVLAGLNSSFQMEEQGGLFFTIWYGVADLAARRLEYAAAGHHAGYLLQPGDVAAEALATQGHRVVVAEAMPTPARKFLMAGKSGLNLTKAEGLADFTAHYGGSAPVLRTPPGYFCKKEAGLPGSVAGLAMVLA